LKAFEEKLFNVR